MYLLCLCQIGFAQPTITGGTCISPDLSAVATVYTVNNPLGNTITGMGQLGDVEITTALPVFPFAGATFQFSARSRNRGREITNTCNDYLKAANNHLMVDAINWGFAKGRLTIFYTTNTYCDKLADLDIYKSFTLHPPVVGPRCIKVGDTVTYSVCNIISSNPNDRIGQDRYYWTGNAANNYTNPADYPLGFSYLYSSADGSSITFLVAAPGFTGQKLYCRFGQCNPTTVSEIILGTSTVKPKINIRNSSGITLIATTTDPLAYCVDAGASGIGIAVDLPNPNPNPQGTLWSYNLGSNNYSWGFLNGTIYVPVLNLPNTVGSFSLPVFIAQSSGEIYLKTSTGCDTRTDVVQISRNLSSPAFTITGNVSLGGNCIPVGGAGIFTLNGQAGNVPINWTYPPNWTLESPANGTEIKLRATSASLNGVITASAGPCPSTVQLALYVKPGAPTQIKYNNVSYNSGSTVCIPRPVTTSQPFEAIGGSNFVAYTWTYPSQWGISGGNTGNLISLNPNGTQTGNITVATNAGLNSSCSSNPIGIAMVYAPTAPPGITGPSCLKGGNPLAVSTGVAQSSVSYSVPIAGGTTYTWNIPAGLAVSGTVVPSGIGNSTVTFTCTGTPSATDYVISVTASTGGSCQSAATTKNVTVRLQNDGTNDEDVFALTPVSSSQTLIHGFPPAASTANASVSGYAWFKASTPSTIIGTLRGQSLSGAITGNYGVEATYSNYACKNVFLIQTDFGYRMTHQKQKVFSGIRNQHSKSFQVTLQPNPAHSSTSLILPEMKTNVAVSVVNVDGRLLWKRSLISSTNTTINTANWASGEYTVIVREPNGKAITQKLIVQKQ